MNSQLNSIMENDVKLLHSSVAFSRIYHVSEVMKNSPELLNFNTHPEVIKPPVYELKCINLRTRVAQAVQRLTYNSNAFWEKATVMYK